MRYYLFICFIIMWNSTTFAQKTWFPFQWVTMPSEVQEKLRQQYENKKCGAESNVYNIGVRNDVEPENGIYCYHGMGPHFPYKLFVYYNKEVYVLDGDVEHSRDSIISSFYKSVDSLNISKADSINYLDAIVNTLNGKKVKSISKTYIKKKNVSQELLEGQWFLQISKKKIGDKIEWNRCEQLVLEKIVNSEDLYSMYFASNNADPRPVVIDGLSLKKAFYYNNKLFLYLTKICTDHTKVSFLISRRVSSQQCQTH